MGGSPYPQTRPTMMGPTTGYAPIGQQSMNGPVAFIPGTTTAVAPLNATPGLAGAATNPSEITYFNTRPGDSVSSVATLYGVTEEELRKSNNLKADDKIAPGQLVRIPDGSTTIR